MIIPRKYIFIVPACAALILLLIILSLLGLLAIPALVLLGVISLAVIFSFYNEKALILLMVFSLPLSVNVEPISAGSIIFPSEVLVGLLTLIFFCRLLFLENSYFLTRSFLKHPLTILVILYFSTLLVSTIFSTMPSVSIKSLLVRFCYLVVFYFMMHLFFKTTSKNISTIYQLYGFALLMVIAYAIQKHAALGLVKSNAAVSVFPFYADHTIYSAAIAFVIPAFAALFFFPITFQVNKSLQPVLGLSLSILIAGLCFSFCRASWISMVVALIVLIFMMLKLRFRSFLLVLSGILVFVSFNYPKLIDAFRQNKFDSNVKNAGFYEQTRSITNITNDVSNAERLNRWSCAARMFSDKPFTGFGIGTYQFQYLSYQKKEEMTRISVTSPYDIPMGHGGSTHSEYLLALSESGIFSILFFIGLFLTSLYCGLKLFLKSPDKKTRITACFVLLSLVTYFTHSLFNNFLENDKLAFLFWSSLSILATLDSSAELK